MILVESVLGSAADDVWTDRLRAAQVDVLRLDQAEAQKSRLRKTTSFDTEVAVSLDRGTQLRDGDVLFWDERGRVAIVAQVDLADVMVIDIMPLIRRGIVDSLATCFELGHALGNQHWAAVVKGLRVYVPLTVGQSVMESVMKTHSFEHVTWTFIPGAEAAARLAPDEARRLFGAVP
jgi:urease accessory protein